MRISFVGKGGAGKSTLSTMMSLYITENTDKPVLVFDADLNIHIPELLGFDNIPPEHHLSEPAPALAIKKWLINKNKIDDIGAFRKTTPPTNQSNIIKIKEIENTPLFKYCRNNKNLYLFAVGTYQNDDIGATCYHNSLAVFENVLSHTDDKDGYLIADMVAGVDAFAGTLHAQFDITVFVLEPTKKSVEVCRQYLGLAKEAGTYEQVFIVGNKIRGDNDIDFIAKHIPEDKILGHLFADEHIYEVDQGIEKLQLTSLQKENLDQLEKIFLKLKTLPDNRQNRLEKIWSLHKKYVSQGFVKDRFGNLEDQIDKNFSFSNE